MDENAGKPTSGPVGRRELLKGAAVAGLAAAAPASAQAPADSDAITAADLAVADKIAGRSYRESERTLMARTLGRVRAGLKAIRTADLPETVEPAAHFDPRLPGTPVPRGRSSFRLSASSPPSYEGRPEDFAFLSAVQLGRLIHAGRISSV